VNGKYGSDNQQDAGQMSKSVRHGSPRSKAVPVCNVPGSRRVCR
jgi:hypothetical protein